MQYSAKMASKYIINVTLEPKSKKVLWKVQHTLICTTKNLFLILEGLCWGVLLWKFWKCKWKWAHLMFRQHSAPPSMAKLKMYKTNFKIIIIIIYILASWLGNDVSKSHNLLSVNVLQKSLSWWSAQLHYLLSESPYFSASHSWFYFTVCDKIFQNFPSHYVSKKDALLLSYCGCLFSSQSHCFLCLHTLPFMVFFALPTKSTSRLLRSLSISVYFLNPDLTSLCREFPKLNLICSHTVHLQTSKRSVKKKL